MNVLPPIADLLERVPAWMGGAVRVERLAGGLSHHIFRVDVDGESFVLRVLDPAVSAAGLGVPPEQEIANTVLAARGGAGPRVHEVLADVPALVIEYLPGRTLHLDDVRDPALIPGIVDACRRLHAGPSFVNDFDIFDARTRLLDVCARHDLPLPDGYHDHDGTVEQVREALSAAPLRKVPCHNDLLAENLILTDTDVKIIDFQLSGNNDPAFELGDLAAEADYDPVLVERLAAAYFGDELTPALTARVRLFLLASNVTWALWFTVHSGLLAAGDVDFDYAAEAAEKWGQARRDLADPDLGRLLDAAAARRSPPTP
jgi:thiamine kinase-like enzyme